MLAALVRLAVVCELFGHITVPLAVVKLHRWRRSLDTCMHFALCAVSSSCPDLHQESSSYGAELVGDGTRWLYR